MSKEDEKKQAMKGANPGTHSNGHIVKSVKVRHEDAVGPKSEIIDIEAVHVHSPEAMRRIEADPDTHMDLICSTIAGGSTIINLSKSWRVGYGSLLKWIRSDALRERRYEKALGDRTEWTIEQVLKELRLMALSDIRELYDANGALKPVNEWPEAAARAVEAVKVDEIVVDGVKQGETSQVKLWSKAKAIELLGKNLKLFIDRVEHHGKVKLEDLVLESYDGQQEADSRGNKKTKQS